MSSEDLFDAITDIDESLIIEADTYRFEKKNKIFPIILSFAAVIVIAVALGGVMRFTSPLDVTPLNELTTENSVSYPEETMHPSSDVTTDLQGEEAENTTDAPWVSEDTTAAENENTSSNEEMTTRQNISVTDHSVENKVTVKPQLLSAPSYPKMAKYPNSFIQYGPLFDSQYEDWREDINELARIEVYSDNVQDFATRLNEKFLAVDDDKNKAISPLSIYVALSLLAECADGNSRNQILSLLGMESIEELRSQAEKLWQRNYRDDGYMKSILANSLWLNNSIKYKDGLLETVTDKYFASVFFGTTGTDTYNKMLNNWIKEQTDGMLSPDMKMNTETVFTIVSTLLYQTKWADEFEKSDTKSGVFKSPSGNKNCQFMTRENDMNYYWSDNFGAIALGLDMGGKMWFILPDEGYDADSIFNDKDLQLLLSLSNSEIGSAYPDSKYLTVNMEIPKFDISVQTDIMKGLSELGLTDITDPLISDFSSLAENYNGIYVDKINHGMRVKIDEKGVSAAAYTTIEGAGAAPPPDNRVEFILDRPFAFAVTLDNETILFAGIVNDP